MQQIINGGRTMKTLLKIVAIALIGAFLNACNSAKAAKPIDYVSPCACYEIIKFTKNKG